MNDGADSMGLHQTPDKERNTSGWSDNRFHREQMAAIFDRYITVASRCSGCQRQRTYILWIGNQMAGSEMSQKRKKHIKSLVFVPEDAGIEFAGGLLI